jgi:hypothetical protein
MPLKDEDMYRIVLSIVGKISGYHKKERDTILSKVKEVLETMSYSGE